MIVRVGVRRKIMLHELIIMMMVRQRVCGNRFSWLRPSKDVLKRSREKEH